MVMFARMVLASMVVLAASPTARGADDLTGKWQVQSMGGDRELDVQQKGNRLIVHRVMWPEFEGEKYKLEHLYRGVIKGSKISGQLLVKEDELPKFEVLRDFVGSIATSGQITLDGLPCKRVGVEAPAAPVAAPVAPERPSTPPPLASATPPAPPPPPAAPEPPPEDPGASLFMAVLGEAGGDGLFKVSNTITISSEAQELTAAGDTLFEKKKYAEALAKYQAADKTAATVGVDLLHRMGRCHLALKDFAQAKSVLRRALKLDPANPGIKSDYDLAKRNG